MSWFVTFSYKFCSKLSIYFNKLSKRFAKAALELNILKYHIQFGEREDDVYIVTYPKSGTTLMQMIVYQLTTDGDMGFNHIYDVSPWTDNDAFLDLPPRELPSPRIIKSHRMQAKFDKDTKGKFIVVIRNVYDVALSQYHQQRNYSDPTLQFDAFIEDFISKKENWFLHCKSWIENSKSANVLFVNYEDLANDFDNSLKKIAQFIECELKPENLPRIKERCSFEFMKKHQDKFGESPVEHKQGKVYDQFIRKGKVGEGISHFSDDQIQKFEEMLSKYGFMETDTTTVQ